MSDLELHELALTSAKYAIEFNLDKYKTNIQGYSLLVSDLATNYLKAKKQIQDTLPNLR